MAGSKVGKVLSATCEGIESLVDFYERADIYFERAEGVYLYSTDGNKYLDMASGYAVNNLGYSHPEIIKSLTRQVPHFWHLCNRYNIPYTKEFCDLLAKRSGLPKIYPCNVGAEAVESGIKFARRYFAAQGIYKYKIITIDHAFHGRTLACATASSEEKMKDFGPPVQGFERVEFNNIDALEDAIDSYTAAVLIEPIQGEGGIRPHDKQYISQLRKLCDKHDILLIFDEIQCGMGRTGYLFAWEYYTVKPDILLLAKGLGCGFPVAAVAMTKKVAQYLNKGDHGSTFGGNPLAMSVGVKVLELMDQKILDNVKSISTYLVNKLSMLREKHPIVIKEIRGIGLMIGIQLHDKFSVDEFTIKMREKFVLIIPAADNVIRVTPPLVISKEEIDVFCNALDSACGETEI